MDLIHINRSESNFENVFIANNSESPVNQCISTGLTKFAEDFRLPQGIMTLIISALGIMFNILNIVILMNPKMKNPVNVLLTFLSFAEMVLLAVHIPYIIMFNLMATPDIPRFVTTSRTKINYFLFYVDTSVFLHMSAVWLIITTAAFRFLIVQFPILAIKWCTYKRAVIAAVLTLTFSLIFCLPNIVRNSIGLLRHDECYHLQQSVKYYAINASEHFRASGMEMFNYWLFASVGKFIPCILLITFTLFLIKILREAKIRRKRLQYHNPYQSSVASSTDGTTKQRKPSDGAEFGQTTRMLLAVVVLFFIVEFPHGVLILWAGATDNLKIYNELGEVIDLMTLTAFSINFVLYCTMSRQYRSLFIALITRPLKLRLRYENIRFNDSMRRSSRRPTNTEHTCMSTGPSELHPLTVHKPHHQQAAMSSISETNSKTTDILNNGIAHV